MPQDPDASPSASDPTDPDPPVLDARRRRLLFRAHHRGTKEADLMIGAFVRRWAAELTEAELDDLEATLDFPDVELSDWLTGRRPVPEDCRSPMLERMLVECAGLGAGLPPELRRP
ncbi:succinate dehydrogenase assembly factor 2 [Paeniroseomonas aquatica]|uniref:FAD assembly factor SdhE n=1 Tax=Paeniroseomonas aquatica TaxID=373043 RepID=A0ABT8A781_9PROT|nr:succinate dehydrogenase assembly factor 2 [Paeniroseomonas aquatica]MDN3565393.1 succinate dehydrogenase assembly factor 2 [Paeniroseomonas aquatica]